MKRAYKNYKHLLTGKVEYEIPNRNISQFNGFMKLNKDPKVV